MPLIMCPNDNSAMTTVDRSGVQFDMCPTCRGVWLDRGEMEKMMEAARSEGASPAADPTGYRPRTYTSDSIGGHRGGGGEGEWGERGEGGEYGERGHGQHRKRSIFDIFD